MKREGLPGRLAICQLRLGAFQEPAHPLPTPHLVAWAGVGTDRGFQKMPWRECSDSIREAILT